MLDDRRTAHSGCRPYRTRFLFLFVVLQAQGCQTAMRLRVIVIGIDGPPPHGAIFEPPLAESWRLRMSISCRGSSERSPFP